MTHWQQLFVSGVEEEITKTVEAILQGKVSDFSEYRYMVGVLRGLRIAQNIADEVDKIINQ